MAFWAAALPFVSGLLSAGSAIWGQANANTANSRQARQQMEFQERMSNTSAQRSVADYRAAGLNPALAYDRPASSPGGASAVIGNVMDGAVSQGLSTARAARDWKLDTEAKREQLQLLKAQTQKTAVDAASSMASGDKATWEARATQQMMANQLVMQPHLLRAQQLNNLLTAAAIPGAQAQAKLDSRMGELGPGLKLLLNSANSFNRLMPR